MKERCTILRYERRPWGRMVTLLGTRRWWLKFLVVGGHTSLQSHAHRTEWHLGFYKVTPKNRHELLPGLHFAFVRGNRKKENVPYGDDHRYEWRFGLYRVLPEEKHRMLRGVYFEFVHGDEVSEYDIVRYEDSYGRAPAPSEGKVVAVSGGFDPLHVGHLEMFEEAKQFGTKLVVILNSDQWLLRKKGDIL